MTIEATISAGKVVQNWDAAVCAMGDCSLDAKEKTNTRHRRGDAVLFLQVASVSRKIRMDGERSGKCDKIN